jgi:hypothetical protein
MPLLSVLFQCLPTQSNPDELWCCKVKLVSFLLHSLVIQTSMWSVVSIDCNSGSRCVFVSQVAYGQGFIALSTICYLETGLLLFLELLIMCYEPAPGGVCKINLLIVGVVSGRFN